MKGYTFSLLIVLILGGLRSQAQITFEQEYDNITAVLDGPVIVEIGPNEHKYLVQDRAAGTFSLFNLDHTPFLEDVDALVPLYEEPFNYEPVLISRTLFDCDEAKIEFAVATTFALEDATFIVQRTDGTELFQLGGATLPYCFGCAVGTRIDQGVINTEAGTKMILMQNEGVIGALTYRIYGLCGSLPNGMREYGQDAGLAAWPNPSGAGFTIEVPDGSGEGPHELVVYSATGERVHEQTLLGRQVRFEPSGLAAGTYYARITSNGRLYTTRLLHVP
jgi:hypothetical protein